MANRDASLDCKRTNSMPKRPDVDNAQNPRAREPRRDVVGVFVGSTNTMGKSIWTTLGCSHNGWSLKLLVMTHQTCQKMRLAGHVSLIIQGFDTFTSKCQVEISGYILECGWFYWNLCTKTNFQTPFCHLILGGVATSWASKADPKANGYPFVKTNITPLGFI